MTLRTTNRLREDIIYTAKAQTIFLRSTMSESSGASPTTFHDEPFDPNQTNDTLVKTQSSPSLLFGNLVTVVGGSTKQISLLVAAPIGERLSAPGLLLEVADSSGVYRTVGEGATQTVTSCSVTRSTQPPQAQWPSPNGTYILTLTGTINGPINVRITSVTLSGKTCTDFRNYN